MDKNFKKKFLKGSAAASIGTISSMAFHFVSIMLLTRHLLKEEFGIYIIIILVVNLFNLIGGLGLEYTLVKFISSENEEERKNVFSPVILMRAAQLILVAVLFYALSDLVVPLFSVKIKSFVMLIPLLFFFTSFRDLFYNLLQGLNLFKKYALVQVISAAVRVGLILAFMNYGKLSLLNLVYIEIGTTFLAVVTQISVVPFKKISLGATDKEKYKKILKFSIPLYFNNLLTFTYDRISIFIIGAYLSPVSVAYYDVAQKVPEALKKIFHSFIIVYFPNISQLFSKGDKDAAENLMNKSLVIISLITTFCVLIAFLFRNEIIILLFSEKYLGSSLAFALLMLNFYLRAISNIMGYSLVSAGYSSVPVKVNSVSSIISIGGSLILIPLFGFIGAVYSLLTMNIVSQIIFYSYLVKAGIDARVIKYLKPLFIILATAFIYFLIGYDSLIFKLTFIAVYVALGWLFIKEFKFYFKLCFNLIPKFKQ